MKCVCVRACACVCVMGGGLNSESCLIRDAWMLLMCNLWHENGRYLECRNWSGPPPPVGGRPGCQDETPESSLVFQRLILPDTVVSTIITPVYANYFSPIIIVNEQENTTL